MKNLQSYEEFLNEKSYQLVGLYGTKGIWGKVLFVFKKQIEKIKFEDETQTLKELNKEWENFAKKEAIKIIKDEVLKQVKDKDSLASITANLGEVWKIDHTINDGIQVKYANDCVINVTFADDVDANKFKRRLGGYVNTPLLLKTDVTVLGEPLNSPNNVEIRTRMYLQIDIK